MTARIGTAALVRPEDVSVGDAIVLGDRVAVVWQTGQAGRWRVLWLSGDARLELGPTSDYVQVMRGFAPDAEVRALAAAEVAP